ncbi:fumarate hydratase [Methanofollis aquaemaris]|uniref:Fumarate hydratase n=1 Tax=Methanofollis aquaemaris TaxID=126734 RepID=A0A8A3S8C5_9EURY|nr:FumA C-terminus/TtdB family hydratase beta subunit [Methanofollis aquaemaris]QSZ68109.1 fumarate hydratase [Methanofollis aquaemaris]
MDLTTPLGDEVLDLRAGDAVTLSGTVYTARDEAHLRMMEEGIPFDPAGAAVYHCGPVIRDGKVVAAGPTTSARMNALSGFLLDAGVRALVGKGGMDERVREALRGRGVYLAFTGGCAALAAARMQVKSVSFEDLGMAEAVWEIELDHLPLIVGIDAHGGDLFAAVMQKAKLQFDQQFNSYKGPGL